MLTSRVHHVGVLPVMAVMAATAVLAVGCGSAGEPQADRESAERGASTVPTTRSSPTPTTATPTTATPTITTPTITTPTTATAAAVPEFEATISVVPPEVRQRMDGRSMRPGCPVGYDALRYLTLSFWDFDGNVQTGELVVNESVALDVVSAFKSLFAARFAIRKMTLVDDYGAEPDPMDGASDFLSIEDNNTSAFNCRRRTGSTSQFSEHSYGRAIDINPLVNPYVTGAGTTSHAGSQAYLDRSKVAPGVIVEGGVATAAFDAIGWGWGGRWSGIKDYQHFSASGR